MKKNNTLGKRAVAVVLAGVIALGCFNGIGAYFTSSDAASDAYSIGKVEIEMVGADNLYAAEKLTPNYEYDFTRAAHNIGLNNAYVFMSVSIPYQNVYSHTADGIHTTTDSVDTQLFTYGANGALGVNDNWKLVDAGQFADMDIEALSGIITNNSDTHGALSTDGVITYVYGYVDEAGKLKELAPDTTTSNLFDIMKLANISDTVALNNIEASADKITTRVFAIQSINVLETGYMDKNNDDGSDVVNTVWSVINNAVKVELDEANQNDGVITMSLTDLDTGAGVPNVTMNLVKLQESGIQTFSLGDETGLTIERFVGRVKTDENGEAAFGKLPVGKYALLSPNFMLDEEAENISITEDDKEYSYACSSMLSSWATSISGVVEDENNNGIADALIEVLDQDGDFITDAKSDVDGSFTVYPLISGSYDIAYTDDNGETTTVEDIYVSTHSPKTDIVISVEGEQEEPGEEEEEIIPATLTNENDGRQQSMITIDGIDYRILMVNDENNQAILLQDRVDPVWNKNLDTKYCTTINSPMFLGSDVAFYLNDTFYERLVSVLGDEAIVAIEDAPGISAYITSPSTYTLKNSDFGFMNSEWDGAEARIALNKNGQAVPYYLSDNASYGTYMAKIMTASGEFMSTDYSDKTVFARAMFTLDLSKVLVIENEEHKYEGRKLPETVIEEKPLVLTQYHDGMMRTTMNIGGVDYLVLNVEDNRAVVMQKNVDAVWNRNDNVPFGNYAYFTSSNVAAYFAEELYPALKNTLGEDAIIGIDDAGFITYITAPSSYTLKNPDYGFTNDQYSMEESRIAKNKNGQAVAYYLSDYPSYGSSFVNIMNSMGEFSSTDYFDTSVYARAMFTLDLSKVQMVKVSDHYIGVGKIGADIDINTPPVEEDPITPENPSTVTLTYDNDGAQKSIVTIDGVDYRVLNVYGNNCLLMSDKVDAVWNIDNTKSFDSAEFYLNDTYYEKLVDALGEDAIKPVETDDGFVTDLHVVSPSKSYLSNSYLGFNAVMDWEEADCRIAQNANGVNVAYWTSTMETMGIRSCYYVSSMGAIYSGETMEKGVYVRPTFTVDMSKVYIEQTAPNRYTFSMIPGTVVEEKPLTLTQYHDGMQRSIVKIGDTDYRILKVENNKITVLQDKVDANWNVDGTTGFGNTDNGYFDSDIDNYLNTTLYNNIISVLGEGAIADTEIDNGVIVTRKIVLPARYDVASTLHGFNGEEFMMEDSSRIATDNAGNAQSYWLREMEYHYGMFGVYAVNTMGCINSEMVNDTTAPRIRAMMILDLNNINLVKESDHVLIASHK